MVHRKEAYLKKARLLIAGVGILLPYLARIPGVLFEGPEWFTSFLGSGPGALVFFGFFNAFCWASILLATSTYRHPDSAWFPVVFGFSMPAVAYSFLDLASSSTAAVALAFIPLFSLPLVFAGWLAGRYYDRKQTALEAE